MMPGDTACARRGPALPSAYGIDSQPWRGLGVRIGGKAMASPKPGQSGSERSLEAFLAQRPDAAESAAAIVELRERVKQDDPA